MVKYENQCVGCPQGCINCGRKNVPVLICDDPTCGTEETELYLAMDGKAYCKYCILHHLEKVEVPYG